MLLLRMGWRNLWRQRKRTLATLCAVAISVTMVLASVSLQQGMIQRMFSLLVEKQTGHIQLHQRGYPRQRSLHDTVPSGEETTHWIRQFPQVKQAAIRIYATGLLATENDALGMQLVGLDFFREQSFGEWSRRITRGDLPKGNDSSGILLGDIAARRLSVQVGEKVVLLAQAADGSLANRLFEVRGLFQSGIETLDARTVVFPRQTLQQFLALPEGGHEIAIQLHDKKQTDSFAAMLRRNLHELDTIGVRTWDQLNPTAARLLGLQRIGTWIVIGIVFGVAALTILNTMLMSVLERVHEFGLLYALGLRPMQVMALVSMETFLLTSLGVVMGGAITVPLQFWLARYGLQLGTESAFSMTGVSFEPILYGQLTVIDALSVLPAVYLLTALTALWPCMQAARLTPLAALRRK